MKNKAHPPEDTLETRSQLHDALRAHADEAHILRLIARGADPSAVAGKHNAYGLARHLGYPASFCQQMEEAFSHWLKPLPDCTSIHIHQQPHSLWKTLESQGWVIWCQSSGQLGTFIWSTQYRLYHGPWEMEAHELRSYDHVEIDLCLPRTGFEQISRLLDRYGIAWTPDFGDLMEASANDGTI